MFSDKQKQSWQNIKAPDVLLKKIENSLDTPVVKSKGLKRIALPLIAALFIFIFSFVLLIGKSSSVDVYLNDVRLTQSGQVIVMAHEPMLLSRSSFNPASVNLTVDAKFNTLVKTNFGQFSVYSTDGEFIYSGNEYMLNEKYIIVWTYQLPFTSGELTLECGIHKSVVLVEYDESNLTQTVKCLKNN